MNPQPRCEVEFDSYTGKFRRFHFFNCPDDREAQRRVVAKSVEQITQQLECPHGLTNKERRQLDRERRALQKAFLETTEIPEAKKAEDQKKLKAAEKKLRRRYEKQIREQSR
jgi:hypothetical protein